MRLWKHLINKKFLTQIILGLMFISFIPCVLYNVYFSHSIRENIETQSLAEMKMELKKLSDSIYKKIDSAHWLLQYMLSGQKTPSKLQRYQELNVIDKIEIEEVVKAITRGVDEYADLCLIDVSNGNIFACNYGMTDKDNARFGWLFQYIDQLGTNGKLVFTKPEKLYDFSRFGYHYYFAVLSASQSYPNIVGAVLFDVESLVLLDSGGLLSSCDLYLFSEDNTIIYPVDFEGESEKLTTDDHGTYVQQSVIGSKLKLLVCMDSNQLVNRIDISTRRLTIISSVFILIILLLIYFISTRLYKPVKQLMHLVYPADESKKLDEFSILSNSWYDLNVRYGEAVDSYENAKHTLQRTVIINNIFGEAVNKQDGTLYRLICISFSDENDIVMLEERLHKVSAAGECIDINDMLVFAVPEEDVQTVLDQVVLPYGSKNGYTAATDLKVRTMDELSVNMAEASFALTLSKLICPGSIVHCDNLENVPEYQMYLPQIKAVYYDLLSGDTYDEEALHPLWKDQKDLNKRLYVLIAILYADIKDQLSSDELLKITGYLSQFISKNEYSYASYIIEFMVNKQYAKKGSRLSQTDINLRKCHEEKMRLAEKYIEEHYQNQISLDNVSENINTSKQMLCEIFREIHNITFVNYLNQYRVEQAKQQLGNPDTRLETISAACGFTSVSYFIRVFKKFTGLTPGEYRKYLTEEGKESECSTGKTSRRKKDESADKD